MTNKKATKRALTLSIISMLICVVMLAGTTFAWFTDSVTSGVNQIVAGNLDVELYHTNDKVTNVKVTEQTDALFNDVALWEPGAVAYETFDVKNVGNLALKYDLSINFTNENTIRGNGLSTALSVGVVDGALAANATRADVINAVNNEWSALDNFVKTGTLEPGTAGNPTSDTYTVVIYWQPKDNDNDWNVNNGQKTDDNRDQLYIDLGVKLFATQLESEVDSFDQNYDKDAYVEVADEAQLKAAIAKGGMVSLSSDIAVTEVLPVDGNTVINLNGHSLNASANTSRPFDLKDGADLTINGSDNTVVKTGKYGLVNIAADTDANVTINGGVYEANTDNGAFIKVRGTAGDKDDVVNVTLNNVKYTDASTNTGYVINRDGFKGTLNVTINGGEFDATGGIHAGNLNAKNVKVKSTMTAFNVSRGGTIDGAIIEITPQVDYPAAPPAGVSISSNGTLTVKNSTIKAKYATAVYTSGGKIIVEDCDVNGGYAHYVDTNSYPSAVYSTTVDGNVPGNITVF